MNKYELLKQYQATRILCQDDAACRVMDRKIAELMEPPPTPHAIIVDSTLDELKNE